MNDIQVAELARQNGSSKEIGTSGLEVYWGQIQKADNTKLFWPDVYDLFNKYLRRDPQVAQWQFATSSMASKVDWYWELIQEKPTDTDKWFLEFLNTIWDDLPGGQREIIDTYNHYRLMGWEWFENVRGRRNGMKAPNSDWVSVYDDGLIGFQDIAWRDHSSFSKWDINENTGKVRGFIQRDYPNLEVNIPLNLSSHIKLGDPTSPEGLSPFEALWRLESFMYNLEIIFGIGSECSAGYLKFQSQEKLTAADHARFQEVARAVQTAVEGGYMGLPGHIDADVIDVPFAAGGTVFDAIKYYGHLKSQVLGIQWMSLSLTGDAGSNASMFTAAKMWLTSFNNDMSGGARQFGKQFATQLREWNIGAFGSVKRLPVLRAVSVEADIDLLELAQFVSAISPVMDNWTVEDWAAVRRKSGFLPEIEIAEIVEDDEVDDEPDETKETEPTEDNEPGEGDDEMEPTEEGGEGSAEFARPVAIGKDHPTVTDADDLADLDDPDDIKRMIRKLKRMDPFIAELLEAEASDE